MNVADTKVNAMGVANVTLLLVRLVAGGLFIVAGVIKLMDLRGFSEAIAGFDLIPEGAEHLNLIGTFFFPWAEVLVGGLIVAGAWTRASALAALGMLLVFIGGILSVLARDMELSCGCFGKLDVICPTMIGSCHVVRNGVHAGLMLVLVVAGSGRLGLDGLFGGAKPRVDAAAESA